MSERGPRARPQGEHGLSERRSRERNGPATDDVGAARWSGAGRTLLPGDGDSPGMKVLVGIGGADDSLDALEESVQRAVETGDELTVAVVENPESDRDPGGLVAEAETALTDAGLPASVRELSGDPGSALVELAESEDFDQIVLGGGHRSPMGKIKLGHIAEFVLLNARTSVKLVRDDAG